LRATDKNFLKIFWKKTIAGHVCTTIAGGGVRSNFERLRLLFYFEKNTLRTTTSFSFIRN